MPVISTAGPLLTEAFYWPPVDVAVTGYDNL